MSYAAPVILAFLECDAPAANYTYFIIELVLSIHPKIAPSLCYMKLLYRARLAGLNSDNYFGVWSKNSVLPEIIGSAISLIVFPVMALLNEGCCKKKEAD
jgi:hypothetical protein